MADYNIDPTSQAYQTAQTRFASLRTMVKPYIKLYFSLPEDKQIAWRAKDPLLDSILTFAERIVSKGADND